jgi:hypothetical protein|tara:strand:- start:692 stop:2272 length:1581 start_codon:yes stop_codon:yes gene_type:complete
MIFDNYNNFSRNGIREIYFSDSLVSFHKDLMSFPWNRKLPECLFARDFELLPYRSPYDIDILLPKNKRNEFCSVMSVLSEKHKLKVFFKSLDFAMLVAIFDLKPNENYRTWVHYEIHNELVIGEDLIFDVNDIEKEYKQQLPIPDTKWRFFLLLMQGIRKNKLSIYVKDLKYLFDQNYNDIIIFCNNRLGITKTEIRYILDNPTDVENYSDKYRLFKHNPYKMISKKKKNIVNNVKTKLSKSIHNNVTLKIMHRKLLFLSFKYLYFLHLPKALFFTINGADGVGKSTAVEIVNKIFLNYPLPFNYFHNKRILLEKIIENEDKEKCVTTVHKKQNNKIKILHDKKSNNEFNKIQIIIRKIGKHKYTPEILRNLWYLLNSWPLINREAKYAFTLNEYLADNYFSKHILLLDRYRYDKWVKNKIRAESTNILTFVNYLFCKALHSPRRVIILKDNPKKIYKRKQELTEIQIDKFQKEIITLCYKFKLKTNVIEINSQTPKEIASKIAEIVITDLGEDLFLLMKKKHLYK